MRRSFWRAYGGYFVGVAWGTPLCWTITHDVLAALGCTAVALVILCGGQWLFVERLLNHDAVR